MGSWEQVSGKKKGQAAWKGGDARRKLEDYYITKKLKPWVKGGGYEELWLCGQCGAPHKNPTAD
eukprot:6910093-Alexandrium_andersonii.AAC.1